LRPRLRSRTIAQHDEIETLDGEPSARSMLLQPVLAGELPEQLRPELSEGLQDAERDAAAAQAQNTTRAYASDWSQFEGWCERYSLTTLPAPAVVIALYLGSRPHFCPTDGFSRRCRFPIGTC
jgi:hypothetical protein